MAGIVMRPQQMEQVTLVLGRPARSRLACGADIPFDFAQGKHVRRL